MVHNKINTKGSSFLPGFRLKSGQGSFNFNDPRLKAIGTALVECRESPHYSLLTTFNDQLRSRN